MAEDSLVKSGNRSVDWYELIIPVRGTRVSLEDINALYGDLSKINKSFGEKLIAGLDRDTDNSDNEWENHKAWLLKNAFCLTITVNGLNDQQHYSETEEVFDNPNLPMPIKSIFFTNVNSFARNANGANPKNKVTIVSDFSKPDIFDPRHPVSAATHNDGHVMVKAVDITFF